MKVQAKYLILLVGMLLPALFYSCSNNDDEGDGSSSNLQINGLKIGKVLMATYSEGAFAGEKWVGFDMNFYLGSDLIVFDFEGTYTSISQIEAGDVISYDDIWLHSFYVLMGDDDHGIGYKCVSCIGSGYNVESGNIKVISVKGSDITLQFNKLELVKTRNEEMSFILNGTVTYTRN